MKFLYFLLNHLQFKEHLHMVRLFIYKCLLFRSREKLYWLLGALGWGSILLLLYGLFNLLNQ